MTYMPAAPALQMELCSLWRMALEFSLASIDQYQYQYRGLAVAGRHERLL